MGSQSYECCRIKLKFTHFSWSYTICEREMLITMWVSAVWEKFTKSANSVCTVINDLLLQLRSYWRDYENYVAWNTNFALLKRWKWNENLKTSSLLCDRWTFEVCGWTKIWNSHRYSITHFAMIKKVMISCILIIFTYFYLIHTTSINREKSEALIVQVMLEKKTMGPSVHTAS